LTGEARAIAIAVADTAARTLSRQRCNRIDNRVVAFSNVELLPPSGRDGDKREK
jgi:hypothetical protein